MESEFWHQRWQSNEIGFHKDRVNPYLTSHWSRLALDRTSRVFVPCCGKTLDLLWLVRQGHDVVGIEISPLAVETFLSENGLTADVKSQGSFTVYSAAGLEIYCGDLFDLNTDIIGTIDAVYDRAAMIAMPPGMRNDYCRQLRRLTEDKAPVLLITMEYPQTEMQGPPFSVNKDEVMSAYGDRYQITQCETLDILAQEGRFREKGVSRMEEHVFTLIP